MMTEDLEHCHCSLCCFFFADENVLKVLSSLDGEGNLGLSQQLVMEVDPLVLRYIRSWEAYPECHIWETSSHCVQPYCR